jgi:hypothetical protein
MKKEIIKITESDLHNIITNTVNKVLGEARLGNLTKVYWQCEFEDENGNTLWKMIYAKTSAESFRRAFEMGRRIGMEPKYETLRNATPQEVKDFQKMIKDRVKNKGEV